MFNSRVIDGVELREELITIEACYFVLVYMVLQISIPDSGTWT